MTIIIPCILCSYMLSYGYLRPNNQITQAGSNNPEYYPRSNPQITQAGRNPRPGGPRSARIQQGSTKVVGYWDVSTYYRPPPNGFRIEDIPLDYYTHLVYAYAKINDEDQ